MRNRFAYISYYQAMAFMRTISQMKEQNPYFNDGISHHFETDVLEQTTKLMNYPAPLRRYKISASMLEYLTRLTKVDIFDSEFMSEFTKEQKQREEDLINKVVNEGFESLKKK